MSRWKFLSGAMAGFVSSAVLSSAVLCAPQSGISPDGQSNYALTKLVVPTKEELQYVKTWGVPWVNNWDRPTHRGITKKISSKYRRQIIMVRHGQYQNEKSADDRKRTLTKAGEEQARLTGKFLAQMFNDSKMIIAEEPKCIYVSDMTRARQTAQLILESFPAAIRKRVTLDPLLRERYPCTPEPIHRHQEAAYKDMHDAEDAFEKYFHRPTTEANSVDLIVGHGNMIRYFVCRSLQIPPEAWLRFSLPHCSLTSVTVYGNGNVAVHFLGSFTHLPTNLQTRSNLAQAEA